MIYPWVPLKFGTSQILLSKNRSHTNFWSDKWILWWIFNEFQNKVEFYYEYFNVFKIKNEFTINISMNLKKNKKFVKNFKIKSILWWTFDENKEIKFRQSCMYFYCMYHHNYILDVIVYVFVNVIPYILLISN